MTLDELKAEIRRLKINAFDTVRMSRDVDPKYTGHQSKEHRALWTIDEAAKKIEKLTLQWEKENP